MEDCTKAEAVRQKWSLTCECPSAFTSVLLGFYFL